MRELRLQLLKDLRAVSGFDSRQALEQVQRDLRLNRARARATPTAPGDAAQERVALNGCPSATAGKNNRQKHFVVDCEAVIVGIADSAFLDRGRGTGWAMGATVSVINVIPVALLRDTSLPLSAA